MTTWESDVSKERDALERELKRRGLLKWEPAAMDAGSRREGWVKIRRSLDEHKIHRVTLRCRIGFHKWCTDIHRFEISGYIHGGSAYRRVCDRCNRLERWTGGEWVKVDACAKARVVSGLKNSETSNFFKLFGRFFQNFLECLPGRAYQISFWKPSETFFMILVGIIYVGMLTVAPLLMSVLPGAD